jgi:hypothetical protein
MVQVTHTTLVLMIPIYASIPALSFAFHMNLGVHYSPCLPIPFSIKKVKKPNKPINITNILFLYRKELRQGMIMFK